MIEVLVLGGGPDRERAVSLESAAAVARGLREGGKFIVHEATIGRVGVEAIRGLPGDVVWPVLHGRWGEGGGLQAVLEADGRPYVGSGPAAARAAMDKVFSKCAARECGMSVKPSGVVEPAEVWTAVEPPMVVKPVFEGSTIGLYVCPDAASWERARGAVGESMRGGVAYMAEGYVEGREVTVGVADLGRGLEALPAIEITAKSGLYDYAAKYERDDTEYRVGVELAGGLSARLGALTVKLCAAMGVRDVARADFMVDGAGTAWFLEINTMPGFTSHSLVPKAAAHIGMSMSKLTGALVEAALRRRG